MICLGSFRCISNNCPEGYRTEHGKCIDIDECHLGIHTCPGSREILSSNLTNKKLFLENARCINIVGSFRCKCIEGFEPNKRKISKFLGAIQSKKTYFMKFLKKIEQ